jgi:hypothetical protein
MMRIDPRREYVKAKRMKVVAKLVDRLESNASHSVRASLFEICITVVDEQDLWSGHLENMQGVFVDSGLWLDPPDFGWKDLMVEVLHPRGISP